MDEKRLLDILSLNKDKSFVQRILNPKDYPSLANPDKTTSTHSMMWGESDGRYRVFPTVLYDGMINKKLKRYTPDEAWEATQQTGNYIDFDTSEEADEFSREYKQYWEQE